MHVAMALSLALIPCCEGSAKVSTPLGNITGNDRGSVWEFLGIPFASQVRWSTPQPPQPYHSLAATSFGPPCTQVASNGTVIGVEDCLSLNVWRPAQVKRLPVMVWIYGGSFLEGSNANPIMDGYTMVSNHQNVIVVSMNYRWVC